MSESRLSYFHSLAKHASARPDAIAISMEPDPASATARPDITWQQLIHAAGLWASQLIAWRDAHHRRPVVLTQIANQPAFFIAWVGTLLADATLFPVSIHTTTVERANLIQQAMVTHGLTDTNDPMPGVIDCLPPASLAFTKRDTSWDAALSQCQGAGDLLLQSSGTTGVSKVVRRSLPALVAVGENCATATGMTADDTLLVATALAHSYMVDHAMMAAMLAGSRVHVFASLDPLALASAARRLRATILPTVPFAIDMLAQSQAVTPDDLASLRAIYTAGTALPAHVAQAFQQRFHQSVGQIYGATEFGSVTYNDPSQAGHQPMAVGLPMPGVTLRIVDRDAPDIAAPLPPGVEGQVAVSAPSMMSGYLNQTDTPFLEGYFLSGDLGILDATGRLTLTGRLKLLVDIAGQKVNLIELESQLSQYPGVRDVVVVPVAVTATVNRLKALVVWSDTPGDVQSMRAWARTQVASYKLPRIFETRDDLPRSPTGKILRQLILP